MAEHSLAHNGHIFQEQIKRITHNSGPPGAYLF
jgi:hypothetical protein